MRMMVSQKYEGGWRSVKTDAKNVVMNDLLQRYPNLPLLPYRRFLCFHRALQQIPLEKSHPYF